MERAMRNGRRAAPRRLLGFTFVELMVVVAIIVILISNAIPVYQKSLIRAKENVLKNNLFTLRTVIDNYTYDKQKAPQALQALVSEGYLKELEGALAAPGNQIDAQASRHEAQLRRQIGEARERLRQMGERAR